VAGTLEVELVDTRVVSESAALPMMTGSGSAAANWGLPIKWKRQVGEIVRPGVHPGATVKPSGS